MFLQLLIGGLSNGALYALVAFGFVVIFNVARWLNFPQGQYMLFGGFLTIMFMSYMPLPVAALLAIIVTAGIGVLFERLTLGRMRQPNFNVSVLIMVGAAFLFDGIMMVAWGKRPLVLPPFTEQLGVKFLGAAIPIQSLIMIGSTVVVGLALWYFFNRQLYGKAMRATSQNPAAARLVGINTRNMVIMAVVLSAGIGAFGGIIIAPLTYVIYSAGMHYGVLGFVAAVVGGGLTSYTGAFVGGILVGLIEAFTIGYITSLYKDAILFAILILVLIFRPTGILGPREVS